MVLLVPLAITADLIFGSGRDLDVPPWPGLKDGCWKVFGLVSQWQQYANLSQPRPFGLYQLWCRPVRHPSFPSWSRPRRVPGMHFFSYVPIGSNWPASRTLWNHGQVASLSLSCEGSSPAVLGISLLRLENLVDHLAAGKRIHGQRWAPPPGPG